MPHFTIIGQIRGQKVIATGNRIRELKRLQAEYGHGGWRKYKGKPWCKPAMVKCEKQKYIGTKRTALEGKK